MSPDETHRELRRTLRSAQATIAAGDAAPTLRFDLRRGDANQSGALEPIVAAAETTDPSPRWRVASSRGHAAAWAIASLGAVSLGVGIGLGAWSLVGQRPELWNPALAAAIGGQGLMIIGLVQMLATLWNAARFAAEKLVATHDEVRRLRRLADTEVGRRHASAAHFFADAAQGVPPERMLGNLRGQLDQLSARLRAG